MLYKSLMEQMKLTNKFTFRETKTTDDYCEVKVDLIDNKELLIVLNRNDFLYNSKKTYEVSNVYFSLKTENFTFELGEDKTFSIRNNQDTEQFMIIIANKLRIGNTKNFQKHKTSMTHNNLNFIFDNINLEKKELSDILQINYDVDIKKDKVFEKIIDELLVCYNIMNKQNNPKLGIQKNNL